MSGDKSGTNGKFGKFAKKMKNLQKNIEGFFGDKKPFSGTNRGQTRFEGFFRDFFAKRDKKGQILAGPGDFLKNRVAALIFVEKEKCCL